MSDRPTPETNAFGGNQEAWIKFAEKLERERDNTQAWVGEIFRLLDLPEGDMGALENFIRQRDEWAALAGQYKSERDELRAYLDAAHYETCNLELREKLDEAMELLRKALEAEQ